MAKKKQNIPSYGTIVINGVTYFRTRITDADGKRVPLYASTCEELYKKERTHGSRYRTSFFGGKTQP